MTTSITSQRRELNRQIAEAEAELAQINRGPAHNTMTAAATRAHLNELYKKRRELLPETRDKRFAVTSSAWDCNGSFQVEILDHQLYTKGRLSKPNPPASERRRVRDLARRVDSMSQIQWVRIDKIHAIDTPEGTRLSYQLTASRLDPSHR